MLQLNIIVPSYQEQQGIEIFLEQLFASINKIKNASVIIVDSGDDQTKVMVREFSKSKPGLDVRVISAAKGRAVQMNQGVDGIDIIGSGDSQYLLFLHCDTALPADLHLWWQRLSKDRPLWGFFYVELSGKRWPFRMIEWMMNQRSSITKIATGDQGIFVRRDFWQQVGAFKVIPLMEDIEACKRFRKYSRPYIHSTAVATSSRRWEEHGIIRTIVLMWLLRLGFFLGVRSQTLARWYRFGKKV